MARDSGNVVKMSSLFLGAILLLIYLKIHGAGIVYFGALIVSILTCFRYRSIQKTIPQFLAFLAFSALMASMHPIDLTAIKQFIYTNTLFLTMAVVLVLVDQQNSRRTERCLLITMGLMILVGVLEVYIGMKPIVDATRSLYTSENSIYEAVERDIRQYGRVRPTVFTSEPSSVGNFFGAIWLTWCCLIRTNFRNAIKATILILAALFVIRSPTLGGFALVAPGLLLIINNRLRTGYTYLLSLLVSLAILFPYIYFHKHYLPEGPIKEFFDTGSFFIRQIAPLNVVMYGYITSPLFGLGSEFYEIARELNSRILASQFGGFYTNERLTLMPDGQFSTNAMWELFGTFGIVGTPIFGGIILWLMRRTDIQHAPAVLLATLILISGHGGIFLAFTWTPLLLLPLAFNRSATIKRATERENLNLSRFDPAHLIALTATRRTSERGKTEALRQGAGHTHY